jgi:hypothetical protein
MDGRLIVVEERPRGIDRESENVGDGREALA